jgi:hypothetical protein
VRHERRAEIRTERYNSLALLLSMCQSRPLCPETGSTRQRFNPWRGGLLPYIRSIQRNVYMSIQGNVYVARPYLNTMRLLVTVLYCFYWSSST